MIRRIIDIFHYDDPIDFGKVADAGIVAVIAKATEGATVVDSAYLKFKRTAATYNFLWGSYHFGTSADPTAQVEHYLKVVRPEDAELICLDFEQSPRSVTITLSQAREFVNRISGL